ncbi:MAG: metallophosphoesterase [Proteobacteria bacterium]|nr:metallophosphoesterase [Pseudomonadota bacterium]
MPPYFKLSKIFLKLAREHGSKVLHGGNTPLLTKDLGDALRRQKKIIEDPDMGVLETTYEALPVIAEVKVLTMAVAKKLDIATKGQSAIGILEEIVQKTEAAGDSKSAQEIKNTLEWTQDFFSKPEIQQILQADLIEIEAPIGDIHGAFDLLDQALLSVGFDPDKDRLIAVGDLINRGPRSADCLYYLAQPWFFSVCGNHEDLFMFLYKDNQLDVDKTTQCITAGAAWMLEETNETLEDIRHALEKLPRVIEIKTSEGLIGIVHGDVPAGMDWGTFKQKLEEGDRTTKRASALGRQRLESNDNTVIDGVHRIFFGHTVVNDGPKVLGNCFYVDTGAVFKLMDDQNQRELYLTLVDIKATEEDILHPVKTQEKLVRIATANDNKPSPPSPKSNRPPKP